MLDRHRSGSVGLDQPQLLLLYLHDPLGMNRPLPVGSGLNGTNPLTNRLSYRFDPLGR